MKGWQTVALGELFDITSSKRVFQSEWQDSGVPFYRAREIVRLVKEGFVENELFISEEMYESYKLKYGVPNPGDLLITGVGTLGICYVVRHGDRFYFKDGNIIWLKNKGLADPRYVYHALLIPEIKRKIEQSSGTTVGTFTIQRANEIKIPIPSLPEQKRIAAILDKAESIRRKREKAIELTDSFLRSVFLEMFGDPVKNTNNWKKVPLAEVSSARLGKMLDAKQQTGLNPRPYLRNTNVKWGYFELDDVYQMDFDEKDREEFRLANGDVLICEGGEVGRAAVWRDEYREMYFQKALHRVRPDQKYLLPDFLAALLKHVADRGGLLGHTSTATIAHLTGVKLKQLPIILPPLELQQRYVSVFTAATETRRKLEQGLSSISNLRLSITGHLLSSHSDVVKRSGRFQEAVHAL